MGNSILAHVSCMLGTIGQNLLNLPVDANTFSGIGGGHGRCAQQSVLLLEIRILGSHDRKEQ
jgi:hypothetical protein